MSKLRFAILGFGHHAVRRLLPAFAASNETELVGLWRRNPQAAAADASRLGITAFASAEALCSSPDVDAVFITSADVAHLADAQLAFAHRKAVLCEKPMAMNSEQASAMLEASQQAGTLFGIAQNFRYNRSLEHIRDQIAAGAIGKPQLAHAQFCYPGHLAPRTWIADPTVAAGGPIADVGVHCIDSLKFVLGSNVRDVTVQATKDELSGEVEAFASLQMRMTDGVLATVTVSARSAYRTLLEVVGSDGVLTAENAMTVDRPVDVVLRRAGELVETRTVSNADGYVRMLDAFAEAQRGNRTFAATAEDGVANQRVLDAAYRSWRSGLRETL